jgi:hypothetical protein
MNTLIVLTRFDESRNYLIVTSGDYRHLNGLTLSVETLNEHYPKNLELYNLLFDEEGLLKMNGYNLSTNHHLSMELLEANKIKFIIFCRGEF